MFESRQLNNPYIPIGKAYALLSLSVKNRGILVEYLVAPAEPLVEAYRGLLHMSEET